MATEEGRSPSGRATSPSDLSPVGSSQSGITNAVWACVATAIREDEFVTILGMAFSESEAIGVALGGLEEGDRLAKRICQSIAVQETPASATDAPNPHQETKHEAE